MARIVVTGGGIVGLLTGLLLEGDGHEVEVLERDAASPPADPRSAWDGWERRGVNQFRMIHYFLPRFRAELQAHLPGVLGALADAGALRSNPIELMPEEFTGGSRPGDERFEALTGRRPVIEAAVARFAESAPGLRVRRGAAVAGLLTDGSAPVPHVTGVRLEDGDEVAADLVVEATGRRSPLPQWLAAAGARPPAEELADCGFVYYGRHFRSADGSIPPALGGLLQHYESISTLTLPADNGTWGMGLVASAKDPVLRTLRHVDTWEKVARSFPLIAHWVDGEPIDDGVAIMAKIEDRRRQFVLDGAPVATGLLAVADSWACTNPSVGRGASIGLIHAVALRDLLREADLGDRTGTALAWDERTRATAGPWFQATLDYDRHRLAQIDAEIAGVPYEPDDPAFEIGQAMRAGSGHDPDVLRAFLTIAGILETADEVLATPGLLEKVIEHGGDWRDAEVPGPSRAELVQLVGA